MKRCVRGECEEFKEDMIALKQERAQKAVEFYEDAGDFLKAYNAAVKGGLDLHTCELVAETGIERYTEQGKVLDAATLSAVSTHYAEAMRLFDKAGLSLLALEYAKLIKDYEEIAHLAKKVYREEAEESARRKELGDALREVSKKAVIKEVLLKPDITIADIAGCAARASAGPNAVQFFDAYSVASREHLLGAYVDALSAFKNGTNMTAGVGTEMLLSAALTDEMPAAVKLVGANPEYEVVVFASSKKAFLSIKQMLRLHSDFRPLADHHIEVFNRLDETFKARAPYAGGVSYSRLALLTCHHDLDRQRLRTCLPITGNPELTPSVFLRLTPTTL
jgi:tRNA threonylcarbamoyladenosine modification (KEOPS) complex Cgi121 subunit